MTLVKPLMKRNWGLVFLTFLFFFLFAVYVFREREIKNETKQFLEYQKETLPILMEQYSDCIGFLDIADSNVHYPIMQNADNEYYLHHDMNGEESIAGCIYMDSNHDIRKKGLHVIYGYHMKDGSMFKDVSRYLNAEYLETHLDIEITTPDGILFLTPLYCYADQADVSYRKKSSNHRNFLNLSYPIPIKSLKPMISMY